MSDTGESAFTTPGGRPPGCLYTTTCDVATGGARLMHRKHESAVINRPITNGPAVAKHHRSCLLLAGGRSPPYFVRVARQNLAELQLYMDDHAPHLANCSSADDDEIVLMSAELLLRLEGGIRAALDEADSS